MTSVLTLLRSRRLKVLQRDNFGAAPNRALAHESTLARKTFSDLTNQYLFR